MKLNGCLILLLLALLALPWLALAQMPDEEGDAGEADAAEPAAGGPATPGQAASPPPPEVRLTAPPPQLAKLERWLGRWKMTYQMSKELAEGRGGTGEGTMVVRKALGGYAMVAESSSRGALGNQEDLSIWTWDPNANELRSNSFSSSTCYRPTVSAIRPEESAVVMAGLVQTERGPVEMLETDTFVSPDRIESKIVMGSGPKTMHVLTAVYVRVK